MVILKWALLSLLVLLLLPYCVNANGWVFWARFWGKSGTTAARNTRATSVVAHVTPILQRRRTFSVFTQQSYRGLLMTSGPVFSPFLLPPLSLYNYISEWLPSMSRRPVDTAPSQPLQWIRKCTTIRRKLFGLPLRCQRRKRENQKLQMIFEQRSWPKLRPLNLTVDM